MNTVARAFAIMVMTLTAPGLSQQAWAQPASPCKPDDIGITVCPNGKSELRMIRGTLSPGKRYAMAWSTEDGSTGSDYELMSHEDYKARFAGGERPTFLVRLGDGKVMIKLKGEHLGDQARYNHRSARAIWSPDESFVATLYDGKWETNTADAYRIGAGGASEPLNLLKLCRAAEQDYFKRTPINGKFDGYSQSVDVKSIGNDGTLAALCSMQVIKEDDAYSFAVHIALRPSGKGLAAKIQSFRRCKDDEAGDCAAPDVPE